MKKIVFAFLAILAVLAFGGKGQGAAQSPQGPVKIFLPLAIKPGGGGAAPVITSFKADPAAIDPGQSSPLSWTVSGATSLSLSPGPGEVTGTSLTLNPAVTTEYTLTAVNAAGSTQAKATVTVRLPEQSKGFFIPGIPEIDRPTSHPTARVDSQGGVHISFMPESNTQADPTRPAYYAYCPANCTSVAAFTITPLGQDVTYANLALDPAGRPRMLLTVDAAGNNPRYEYGTCDTNCASESQWNLTFLTGFTPPQNAWGVQFGQTFALDSQGRPRFIYQDWGDGTPEAHAGNFYAFCDANCGSPANWSEVKISDDLSARVFNLALTPAGLPRLLWTSYDSENIATYLAYAECSATCGEAGNWQGVWMADTVSASVEEFASYSLQITTDGKPRMALYTGTGMGGTYEPNKMYYLYCDAANCIQTSAWHVLDLGLPYMHGEEGVSLALDGQNRPRLAYHAPLTQGYGLYYAWCNTECEASSQGWLYQEIEPSEQVNQELPIPPSPGCSFPQCNPPEPPCTISSWNDGVRPSLALDPTGNPRIAYDADHEQGGGCTPFTDTHLTRFFPFNQP